MYYMPEFLDNYNRSSPMEVHRRHFHKNPISSQLLKADSMNENHQLEVLVNRSQTAEIFFAAKSKQIQEKIKKLGKVSC